MACLRPQRVVNPKYRDCFTNGALRLAMAMDTTTYVNRGFVADYYVDIPCGKCVECLKNKAKSWRVRLLHEWKYSAKKAYFITLTVAPEHYDKVSDNPSRCLRAFLELYRYHYKKSLRHWFVTELGEQKDRLHFHGVVFDPLCLMADIHNLWKYGFVWVGWCDNRTFNYIVKYINKPQLNHRPKVYVSKGLGKAYCEDGKFFQNQDVQGLHYVVINGYRYTLPRYYRDKVFDSELLRYWHWLSLYANPIPEFMEFQGVQYPNNRAGAIARREVLDPYLEDSINRGTSLPLFEAKNKDIKPGKQLMIKYGSSRIKKGG